MSAEDQSKPRSHLLDIAIGYFKKEGYKINSENVMLEGHSGVIRHFDLIVQKGRLEQGVWVRDWNRTIGVNVIINLDTASEDVDLSTPNPTATDAKSTYSLNRKSAASAKP
jgi:hypothetical protein